MILHKSYDFYHIRSIIIEMRAPLWVVVEYVEPRKL